MDATNPVPGDLSTADAHSKAYTQAMDQQAAGERVQVDVPAPVAVQAAQEMGARIEAMRAEAEREGIRFLLGTSFESLRERGFETSEGRLTPGYIINAAGLHADTIARQYGFSQHDRIVPFKGLYLYGAEKAPGFRTNIYPVPDLRNPFLGVHFTLTIDHKVKIGPTAIPIAGREQYSLLEGWSAADIGQAIKGVLSLVKGEAHDFGTILKSEWPKMIQAKLVKESSILVPDAISVKTWNRKPPGIRAQLVHLPSGKLEQDFVVRGLENSTHVLNAVSPGWTSSLPFGRWVAAQVSKILS
jgi:L-2-hydroxyglutarate oxidase LhgO